MSSHGALRGLISDISRLGPQHDLTIRRAADNDDLFMGGSACSLACLSTEAGKGLFNIYLNAYLPGSASHVANQSLIRDKHFVVELCVAHFQKVQGARLTYSELSTGTLSALTRLKMPITTLEP